MQNVVGTLFLSAERDDAATVTRLIEDYNLDPNIINTVSHVHPVLLCLKR